jgi:hypothetical protein
LSISSLKYYLEDPLLQHLYSEIKKAGPIRSVSLDITNECNLRCKGCYFFEEGMDRHSTNNESLLDQWIQNEKLRGTNFVTIVGGEPSLALLSLKKLYNSFNLNVATNGLIKIPKEGFENLPIGIAVWGNHKTDSVLRANGKRDLFKESLNNYKDDSRAFWYYTIAPGNAQEIESVVEECIQNGNRVLFNYYSDISSHGGHLDYRHGFEKVMNEVDRMIELYPDKILSNHYFNRVVGTGKLYDMEWGYDVCTNLSVDNPINTERLKSGVSTNKHFNAYNSDFTSTRRCCTGVDRNCDSCFDTWEHFSWIMVHMKKHLGNKREFGGWLSTMYQFYHINRLLKNEPDKVLLRKVQYLASNAVKTEGKKEECLNSISTV